MKIVMMGAGAMGSLFAGFLASSGEEVWLVDIRQDQIDAIRSAGLTVEKNEKPQIFHLNATSDVTSVGNADLVIFFVKSYHTEKAASDAFILQKGETIFLSLQNGLGNEEAICKWIDPKKVMLGVTNHGATLLGPGHIRHAGWGKTYIGERDGKITDRVTYVARTFSNAKIETEVSPNIHDLIWDKLLTNIGINALTALTGLKNGQLLDYPETLRLMETLISEAAEVAEKKGIRMIGDPIYKAKAIAEATRKNRSSMGQDIDFKRKTEIDAINGAVVREAERLGISVPYNQVITDLIKVIERRF